MKLGKQRPPANQPQRVASSDDVGRINGRYLTLTASHKYCSLGEKLYGRFKGTASILTQDVGLESKCVSLKLASESKATVYSIICSIHNAKI